MRDRYEEGEREEGRGGRKKREKGKLKSVDSEKKIGAGSILRGVGGFAENTLRELWIRLSQDYGRTDTHPPSC